MQKCYHKKLTFQTFWALEPVTMMTNDQCHDDTGYYHHWRSTVQNNEYLESVINTRSISTRRESSIGLSRRLSLHPGRRESVRSSKYDEEGFENVEYKVPKGKDEEIIIKREELELVEEDLQKMR